MGDSNCPIVLKNINTTRTIIYISKDGSNMVHVFEDKSTIFSSSKIDWYYSKEMLGIMN